MLVPLVYYLAKQPLAEWSEEFYDANIRALNWLAETTGWGYIGISLVIGVVVPILVYMVLWSVPKRWLLGCYLGLMVGNLVWYIWVLRA